jgi:tRNA-modifying protein YgfZ
MTMLADPPLAGPGADGTMMPAGGTTAPLALAVVLRRPIAVPLRDVGVLAVQGADAEVFLNGQLTIDTRRLEPSGWQLGAYCSTKGRVLALFEAWRTAEGYCLVMPAERVTALASRLSRYVLRAKVRIFDDSASWAMFGLTGPGADEQLRSTGWELPQRPWTRTAPFAGAHLALLPPSPRAGSRWMLAVPAPSAERLRASLPGFSDADPSAWWWAKVDAGLPEIFASTEERFVPQMLNLDVLGGVHFGKGCYPGQEIVARSQYLGKLRRRMMRGHAARAGAGDDIAAAADGAPVLASVVMAVASPDGGVDLLLEGALDPSQPGPLRLASDPTVAVTIAPPPYELVNPTA